MAVADQRPIKGEVEPAPEAEVQTVQEPSEPEKSTELDAAAQPKAETTAQPEPDAPEQPSSDSEADEVQDEEEKQPEGPLDHNLTPDAAKIGFGPTAKEEKGRSKEDKDEPKLKKIKRGSKQNRYLAQSVVLEESGLSGLVRGAIFLVSLSVICFALWAWFSMLDEIAPTTGEVIPEGPVQMVQHLEGGIVREVLVRPRELVEKGQLLVKMDPDGPNAEYQQMRARWAHLTLQAERLRAYLEDHPPNFGHVGQSFPGLERDQWVLLKAQRIAYESERMSIDVDEEKTHTHIRNLEAQQEALRQRLLIHAEELALRERGLEKGLVSRMVVLGTRREVAQVQEEIDRVRGEILTSEGELNSTSQRMVELESRRRQEGLMELNQVAGELAQVTEGLRRLKSRMDRLEIRSPVRGVVQELLVRSVQGVLAPGGLVAQVVPMEETVHVETRINSRDIGHVTVGQKVTIKVQTYDFARYGGIDGILKSVSPTTFEDEKGGEPFYKGLVRLEKSYVGNNPNENRVLPGMVVQADIHTGSKTLAEYILKPIYASVNKAFRER
ncbi:MAG: HlyD family type I secretion periplasmic adaptor subunit [Magnetococcales bacterium]|nr:HlyD family type I secretion periplasmic adaptor subunit [Magnetococcales bacterium]